VSMEKRENDSCSQDKSKQSAGWFLDAFLSLHLSSSGLSFCRQPVGEDSFPCCTGMDPKERLCFWAPEKTVWPSYGRFMS
jgi:hypothetical protein